MIKRILIALALVGAMAACSPAATSSPTTPALDTAPPAGSPSTPSESPTLEESAAPSSS